MSELVAAIVTIVSAIVAWLLDRAQAREKTAVERTADAALAQDDRDQLSVLLSELHDRTTRAEGDPRQPGAPPGL